MANLRLLEINVDDCVTITAKFTQSLDPDINTACISIKSNTYGVPDLRITSLYVDGPYIVISTSPMTPYASYTVKFYSNGSFKFKSKDGSSFILDDGKTNCPKIIGYEDPANPSREFLLGLLKDSAFALESGNISRSIIDSQAVNLARALYDIRQLKNDNYLTVDVIDELKTRGRGPWDRLNEEGAYVVTRVGKNPSGSTSTMSLLYNDFPETPITLLSASTSEVLNAGVGLETFNGLIYTVKNKFVTKLKSLHVSYDSGGVADYPIDQLGYQLYNSRYDENASTYLLLDTNQIKLSDNAVDNGFVLPKPGDVVNITYEYESRGRVIDSVAVYQILDSVREVMPPIVTEFFLKNAPITTQNGLSPSSNAVKFLDPQSDPPFSAIHPAFTVELPFSYEIFPSRFGEYSVEYSTGRVFVYGATINDGTGEYPPVATYSYKKSFDSRLDYTYDPTTSEIVANPLRDLIGKNVNVEFDYEQVLVPGIDYKADVHVEVLNERIGNRLRTTNSLSVANPPITNVFRVYNETSGEIYQPTRWNDSVIYFNGNNPPTLVEQKRERVSFSSITDELLIVDNEIINALSVLVFKLRLSNGGIVSSSEDSLGSSYNSTLTFSKEDIFSKEIYFDHYVLTEQQNYDKLIPGQYIVDYVNGIVYVGVSVADYDIGTVSYKKSVISTEFPHVTSVSALYFSMSNLDSIAKNVDYSSFFDGGIIPSSFEYSDERFIDNNISYPFIVDSGTIKVNNNIKNIRGIYDAYDLNNNVVPTNFSEGSDFSSNIITLNSIGTKVQQVITLSSANVINIPFISNGIEIGGVESVVLVSTNVELTVSGFSGYNINLNLGGQSAGDDVLVTYFLKLNSLATPVVDYSRGDYFVDYTYLQDEILISYEYGDNNIDFRESTTISEGNSYYVSYKVGALRDALLKNFGTLVDLPILNSFDTSLARESYRDSLRAALQSFTKGPTLPSMTELVSTITHIDPEIIESVFLGWYLGVSRLNPSKIDYSDNLKLLESKHNNGLLISDENEFISFPVCSNLRLEEGTLEFWATPEWDGLDNDATLTFELFMNDVKMDPSNIHIGASGFNPEDSVFSLNRIDVNSPIGKPSNIGSTDTAASIYYDEINKLWNISFQGAVNSKFSGKIISSGEVYNVNKLGTNNSGDIIRSTMNKVDFALVIDSGDDVVSTVGKDSLQLMADNNHYLFDFGKEETKSRFSIYKDGRGYLNFRVFDDRSNKTNNVGERKVSSDISSWKSGEKHHIAVSWRLGSSDGKDEMHLFLDGYEVFNILKYGGRPEGNDTDRFRSVVPEVIAGVVSKNAITGNDMSTTVGSAVVTVGVNAASYGIVVGDVVSINEIGFGNYTIVAISGFDITLDATMPIALSDAKYAINQFSIIVNSEVDLYSNIAVSRIDSSLVETEIPGLRADVPSYGVSKNIFNENVLTIFGNVEAGDTIAIRTFGLNHRRFRDRQYLWGDASVLKTQLPAPINLDEVKIYSVTLPLTNINPSNSTLTSGKYIYTNTSVKQPIQSTTGRTQSVRVTGGNTTFSTPVTVKISGTDSSGAVTETMSFSNPEIQDSSNKYITITSIEITVTPIDTTKNSISVEIKDKYEITKSDGSTVYPVIRFSYLIQNGNKLESGSATNIVTDNDNTFVSSCVGQSLVITAPSGVAGTYQIIEFIDEHNIKISSSLSSFANGSYGIYNVTESRSGFQNGFFNFEQAGETNVAFMLNNGYYDFDYSTYLSIPFDPMTNVIAYIGSDLNKKNQSKVIIDEFRILSSMLTDVRIGETIFENEDSITTDALMFNSFRKTYETLMLLHMDKLPLVNDSNYWITSSKDFMQSSTSVNENFGKSIVITDKPLVIDNFGKLYTQSEGSIEFWVSPKYDTANDPNMRFYFDATASVMEEVQSINAGLVKVKGSISKVLSITVGDDDYNYYAGGIIESDFQTIQLGKSLPYQNMPVKIHYIPNGSKGNRLSIYKDNVGFLCFSVIGSLGDKSIDYQIRKPIFWQKNTWHRVKATYRFNSIDNKDEIRLFVDGGETGVIRFGTGLLFGSGIVFGQEVVNSSSVLFGDINFTDTINEFIIGGDISNRYHSYARFDNLKISNANNSHQIVAGKSRDINYSSNTKMALPVVEDLFTTYLLNFDTLVKKEDEFVILKDEISGIFNFEINIIDSFDIVSSSAKLKQILETLIYALKPAQSKVVLNYINKGYNE